MVEKSLHLVRAIDTYAEMVVSEFATMATNEGGAIEKVREYIRRMESKGLKPVDSEEYMLEAYRISFDKLDVVQL